MTDVRANVVRFVAIVLAVDLVGLGAWRLLPPEASIRTGVLFGALVIGPLVGFLVVYAPAASRAAE